MSISRLLMLHEYEQIGHNEIESLDIANIFLQLSDCSQHNGKTESMSLSKLRLVLESAVNVFFNFECNASFYLGLFHGNSTGPEL